MTEQTHHSQPSNPTPDEEDLAMNTTPSNIPGDDTGTYDTPAARTYDAEHANAHESFLGPTASPAGTTAFAEPTSGIASWRHPVNTGHLVMGVAFLGLAAVWALITSGLVEGADARWLLPLPWLAAGAAGVAVTVASARRRTDAY